MPPEPAAERDARRALALVLALTVLAWGRCLVDGGFALDDREAIVDNPVVEGSLPPHAAFLRDYWHHHGDAGHWRPIATLSLRLDHALHGLDPRGYHATSLALHLAVVALAGHLLLAGRPRHGRLPGRALALALFALHPAHADVVAWISGRTSSLSVLGGLLGMLAAVRARGSGAAAAGAGLGLFLALGAKEDGIVFAPWILALALPGPRRRSAAVAAGLLAGLVLAGLLRTAALGSPLPSAPHALLADRPWPERLEVGGRSLAGALTLLAAPLPHAPSIAPGRLLEGPLLPSLAAWLLWAAALGGGTLVALAGRRRLAGLSLAAAAVAYLPHMQVVPSGELLAPRFLYLPMLLALPFLGEFLSRMPRRAVLVGLAALLPLAWIQSGAYAGRAAYWRTVARHAPGDARAWNALGNAAREEGRREEARAAYRRSVELRPAYSRPWTGLGTLALEDGDLDAALELLGEAARRGPDNARAHGNLGVLHLRRGEPGRAREAYRRAVELSPGTAALWRGLGRAHAEAGEEQEARSALERALALDPGDGLARELLEGL